MSERWTDAQTVAVTTADRDVIVSAGAGTGKTAVLVEHVLGILRDGAPPERVLVITFTRKAAEELRERLYRALSRADEPRLRELLPLLPRAYISTIDSFCQRLLRESAVEAGIDPAFRILDETAASLLLGEVVDEVLDGRFERSARRPDHRFEVLVELTQRGPDGLGGELRTMLEFVRATPDPRKALGVLSRRASLPYRRHYRSLVEEDVNHLSRTAGRLCIAVERQLAETPGAKRLRTEAMKLTRIRAVRPRFRDLWRLRDEILGTGVVSSDAGAWKADLPRAGKLSADAKSALAKLKLAVASHALRHLPASPMELLEQERQLAGYAGALEGILEDVLDAYEERKRDRGLLDFADLEILAARFLEEEASAGSDPARRFDHVVVDEFQDVNRLQAQIIDLLSRGRRRFLVGDVKQCIYQFRLAAPGLLRDLLQEHHLVTDPAAHLAGREPVADGRGIAIHVRDSFRSRAPVLDVVNRIFANLFCEESLGLPYAGQELSPGLDYASLGGDPAPDPPVELHVVHPEEEGNDGTSEEIRTRSAAEREALVTARRLRAIIETEKPRVWDKREETWRPARWGDVAVLLRSPRPAWGATFLKVFRQERIPVHLGRGLGFFEAEEIRDALNLFRVLDNAFDDIPLASLLRSPVFGWTDGDLVLMRHAFPESKYLWLSLRRLADGAPAAADAEGVLLGPSAELPPRHASRLRGLAAGAREKIEAWRGRLGHSELESSLAEVLNEAGLPLIVSAHPEGPIRQANLQKLLDLVQRYSRDNGHSLRGLLAWLDEVRVDAEPLAQIPGEAEEGDTVKILSIHMAKGLEFPIVAVAQLGQALPLYEHRRSPLLTTADGLGMDLLEPRAFLKTPTLAHWTLRTAKERTEVFEEMRVLYVALTRARERLLLIGSVTHPGHLHELPSLPLRSRDLWSPSGHSALRGWILPVLSRDPVWRRVMGSAGSTDADDVDPLALEVHAHNTRDIDRGFPAPPLEPAPSPTRSLIAANEPLGAPGPAPEDVRRILETARIRPPRTWLSEFQGRYWVTEVKRRTDAWRAEEAAEDGPRAQWIPEGEEAFAWPASLLASLDGAATRTEPPEATPRAVGEAVHLVLEKMDLEPLRAVVSGGGAVTAADVEPGARDILARHRLPRHPETVRWLVDFYNSETGRSLLEAWGRDTSQVYREASFTLKLSLAELRRFGSDPAGAPGATATEDELSGEWTLLQGQIDVLFRDAAGGWILLDYKTDSVSAADAESRAQHYLSQIRMYELAARRLWKAEPLRSRLHFLRPGRTVEMEETK